MLCGVLSSTKKKIITPVHAHNCNGINSAAENNNGH